MAIESRDYKLRRDERRRQRKFHLDLRRTSGKAFEGGQSEAEIAVSSETGLAETETIALSAVNDITTIFDDTTIVASSYGGFEDLEIVTIEGGGFPVLLTFTDLYNLSVTYTDDLSIIYRLRVVDPDGNTVVGIANVVYSLIVNAGETYNGSAESPDLFLVVELAEGVVYRVDVQFRKERTVPTDTIVLSSEFRNLVIHELKR